MNKQYERLSSVALFADLYETPKIFVAKRGENSVFGDWKFPGEKRGTEVNKSSSRQRVWDETGQLPTGNDRLHRVMKPIIFDIGNTTVEWHLRYVWVGSSTPQSYMDEWSAKYSPDRWEWHPFRWFREQVILGAFPKPVYEKVIWAAKKGTGEWVGDTMTWYQYDFPHAGLHRHRR
jgi:hypothetical protein